MNMMKKLKPKWRVCVDCLSKLKLSDAAVRTLGWVVWQGASRCDRCTRRMKRASLEQRGRFR